MKLGILAIVTSILFHCQASDAQEVRTGALSPANPTATAGPTAVNGTASTFMTSDSAPAVQKGSTSQFGVMECDGTTLSCTGGVMALIGSTTSGANSTATAGPTAVNGVAITFMRSDGAPAIQLGTNAQKGLVQVDGTTITATAGVISSVGAAGANPTATAGVAAVNGVATTYLRSDGAPAVAKASNSVFGIAECDNSTITCPGGVFTSSGGTPLTPAPISGDWYAAMLPGPTATATPSASSVYCTPFSIVQSTTIKSLGVNVSTNDVGKFVGLAIYNNISSRPSTLVDFVSTLTLAGTGALSGAMHNTTDVLAAGVYWACATTSSSSTAGFYAPSGLSSVSYGIVGSTTLASAIGASGAVPTVACTAGSTCGGSFAAWSGSTFAWFTFSATWLLTNTGLGVAFQVN